MPQKNSSGGVSRRQKMLTALDLRAAGGTYDQIGKAVGVSRTTAWKLVSAAIDELNEKCHESAERVRSMELFRLDKMRVVLWPKRADPRVADTLLRISERVARLHGLDVTRTELTGPDGGPVEVEQGAGVPDLTRLSDEEIVQLARINAKINGKG